MRQVASLAACCRRWSRSLARRRRCRRCARAETVRADSSRMSAARRSAGRTCGSRGQRPERRRRRSVTTFSGRQPPLVHVTRLMSPGLPPMATPRTRIPGCDRPICRSLGGRDRADRRFRFPALTCEVGFLDRQCGTLRFTGRVEDGVGVHFVRTACECRNAAPVEAPAAAARAFARPGCAMTTADRGPATLSPRRRNARRHTRAGRLEHGEQLARPNLRRQAFRGAKHDAKYDAH